MFYVFPVSRRGFGMSTGERLGIIPSPRALEKSQRINQDRKQLDSLGLIYSHIQESVTDFVRKGAEKLD